MKGEGASHRAADVVVEEIRKAGGKAVANYDSVEDGDKIIETAIKAFGRVDIVINNAGILRDVSLKKMTDKDWDLINAVHVRGTYKVTKAAWEHMRKQKFGRIINTASAAGIYGNFGQTNYAAAKLAIWGFSNTLWREGQKDNILVNTIAPIAGSRLTETVMPAELVAALKPEFVTPLVAWLCAQESTETGGLFEVGAGFFCKLRWQRSEGALFRLDESFTPGAVAAQFEKIGDFDRNPQYPQDISNVDYGTIIDTVKTLPKNPTVGDLRFDGKVVIVTGAGGGIGRAYAHLFARQGASVVVNDLGGSVSGGADKSSRAADVVVEEIRKVGGKAVANYDSVEEGDKIVATAVKAFGRLDVLVNNAGILRDKSFSRITDEDWDLVNRVHLRGTYKVTKAAYDLFLEQKYGRIVNTSSSVGLYGNFGQTNYSAAKAGILGFSNSVAQEGKKSHIYCNTICPQAATRMTAGILPGDLAKASSPEYIAPLVVYLCHESCEETGSLFEVGCGWVGKVRRQQSSGYGFPVKGAPITPELIAGHFREISDFDNDNVTYPLSPNDSIGRFTENAFRTDELSPNATSALKSAAEAQKTKFDGIPYTYTDRDVILYALGVGATRHDLKYVFENHEAFGALPTFGVIPAFGCMMAVPYGDYMPNFDFSKLLHGEQYLEVRAPLATSGTLISTPKVVDILDKGKGAIAITGVDSRDESGKLIFYNEFSTFIRGSGGFGGHKDRAPAGDATASNDPPSRAPDAVVTEKTGADQAALYRLSGDSNPLHLDPDFAAMGGFDTPILHGLCSFGIAGKHVLQTYGNDDPNNFKSIKVRFSKHVFPGETLRTEMWKEGNKIIFQVRVVERNELAITNAAVVLVQASAKPVLAAAFASVEVAGFQSSKVFQQIKATFDALPEAERKSHLAKVKGIFQFEVKNTEGKVQVWSLDLKETGAVTAAPSPKPDITISVSDGDFVDLASGKLNGQKAFMSGKIKGILFTVATFPRAGGQSHLPLVFSFFLPRSEGQDDAGNQTRGCSQVIQLQALRKTKQPQTPKPKKPNQNNVCSVGRRKNK